MFISFKCFGRLGISEHSQYAKRDSLSETSIVVVPEVPATLWRKKSYIDFASNSPTTISNCPGRGSGCCSIHDREHIHVSNRSAPLLLLESRRGQSINQAFQLFDRYEGRFEDLATLAVSTIPASVPLSRSQLVIKDYLCPFIASPWPGDSHRPHPRTRVLEEIINIQVRDIGVYRVSIFQ